MKHFPPKSILIFPPRRACDCEKNCLKGGAPGYIVFANLTYLVTFNN